MDCNDTVWHPTRGADALPQDEVHVWRASLVQTDSQFAALTDLLSAEERDRAGKFYFEADRKRCVLARGLSRLLLGRCLGRRPEQVQFQYNEFGKPFLAGGLHPSVQFNVSHSGDLVLVALTRDRAIGVDVECMRADLATEDIAARFFSAAECKALATVSPAQWSAAFFACWTRKEAYLKARGDGLSLPLASFDVSLLPGDDVQLLAARHDATDVGRWTLRALEAGDGYQAALAVERRDWKLKCWDWQAASVGNRGSECSGVSIQSGSG